MAVSKEGSRIYYPLTDLLHEAREKAPKGQTFAVKRVIFPTAGSVSRLDRRPSLADFRILNTKPENYLIGARRLAGGLAVADLSVLVKADGFESVQTQGSVTIYERGEEIPMGRQTEAVRLHGQAVLPISGEAPVIGAYVPGEPSTGFLHVLDADSASWVVGLFEQG